MGVDISIIIPVYNTEKYLRECLDSVINQTFKNIEIICVNDGSTDNSLEVLKEYAQKDKRIVIKQQENKKVAAARNNGYKSATGKYVYFLDTDDYLYRNNSLEIIYNELETKHADVAVWGILELIDGKFIESHTIHKIRAYYNNPENFNFISLNTSTTYKMFRKKFLDAHGITFPECIPFPEDTLFSLESHFNKPKYVFINDTLHVYRKHNSSTTGKNKNLIKNILKAIKLLESKEIYQKQPIEIKMQVVENWLKSIKYYYDICKNHHKQHSLKKDMLDTIIFLEKIYDTEYLKYIPTYCQIKEYYKTKFYHNIFSVKNQNNHKVVKILGFKIKFKRKIKTNVTENKQIQNKEMPDFKQLLDRIEKIRENAVTICFSANNNFFEYLFVCIYTLKKQINKNNFYDIVILERNISEKNKNRLKELEKENLSIRFYNIDNFIKTTNINFSINYNFSIEVYFRLFIPIIFKDYEKVLYMDCDGVFVEDVAQIFNENIENFYFGAVKDYGVINHIYIGSHINYYLNKLCMKEIRNYINSGVLLMNIQELNKNNFTDEAIALMQKFQPLWVDQCIINKIAETHIKFLNPRYNSSSLLENLVENIKNYKIMMPQKFLDEYNSSKNKPIFVHYMSGFKPWKYPNVADADLFWDAAKEAGVYERILFENLRKK